MMISVLSIFYLIFSEHQIVAHTSIIRSIPLFDDTNVLKSTAYSQINDGKGIEKQGSLFDDIIELNIGGQKMTTLRSTLTAVPNSKLASMFNKQNTKYTLATDKQGAVFFDYNPMYFSYLLDQLRTIKKIPKKYRYPYEFLPPFISTQVNFTQMLFDLGLTPDYLLSPMEGTHANLTVNSLAGWRECYRSTYDKPFDSSVLTKSCNGSRLLVACRSVNNKKILTLAAIGQRDDILHPCLPRQCKTSNRPRKKNRRIICPSRYQCITQAKRGVGWYYAQNQTWGFVRGSLSFVVNPCDASLLDSDYRLCWTLQSNVKQGHGDRCGSAMNLETSNKWERIIYNID